MKLWQKILIGLFLGVLAGVLIGPKAAVLKPVGVIFINMIKMVVIPLIFFSIVAGVTSLNDPKTMGRVGLKAVTIYMMTTAIAVSIGLFIGTVMEPGRGVNMHPAEETRPVHEFSFVDTLVGIVPTNPVASMAEGNILQVIFFAIFLGVAAALAGEKAQPALKVNQSLADITYKMVEIIMKFAPYGVFALMAWVASTHGLSVLLPLLKLIGVTFFAYIVHVLVMYGGLIRLVGRLSPLPFFRKVVDAQAVAFTTSSSSATLPVTMRVAHENLGVSGSTASFVLPLGTTINMDGSAIYLGVCALFVAQAAGIDLGQAEYITLMLTATLVSIGIAGVPSGGLTMLAIVLGSVNLPLEGVALIAAVDRILDMGRTTVNVTGDTAVSVLIDKSEGHLNLDIYHKA